MNFIQREIIASKLAKHFMAQPIKTGSLGATTGASLMKENDAKSMFMDLLPKVFNEIKNEGLL